MEKLKIENIWKELEDDQSLISGLIYKRYSAEISQDIFIGLKKPGSFRCLGFLIDSKQSFDFLKWNTIKEIKLEFFQKEDDKTKKFLLVLLVNPTHQSIFSTLCHDLINHVKDFGSEEKLIQNLTIRLGDWQNLFEKLGEQGLSDEAQRGLFGELFFLRKFLQTNTNSKYCIDSWKGPEKAVQDFQFSDWAVEVKTTHGKNHQKIYIASERQLDTSLVPRIYLYHISMEVREMHGETLNEIIKTILNLLSESPIPYSSFQFKLFEAGYFETHKEHYQNTGYSIRELNIFEVKNGFPRITERMIPPGVGDVKYSIIISDQNDFLLSEDLLFDQINVIKL
jgi:hypothetical protein